jgi:hypothetical protein
MTLYRLWDIIIVATATLAALREGWGQVSTFNIFDTYF